MLVQNGWLTQAIEVVPMPGESETSLPFDLSPTTLQYAIIGMTVFAIMLYSKPVSEYEPKPTPDVDFFWYIDPSVLAWALITAILIAAGIGLHARYTGGGDET